ncbi:hypothetical protein CEXT_204211 [Caerostris extrusa]|uniref:Uncharacterized protein n=1 Tax=Caerostris extrusa TaxID=172846 RepID=A0AAV4USM6_CAEEX|nr:hypothetical protein CEXT_204211 [Caerostris extrusa]
MPLVGARYRRPGRRTRIEDSILQFWLGGKICSPTENKCHGGTATVNVQLTVSPEQFENQWHKMLVKRHCRCIEVISHSQLNKLCALRLDLNIDINVSAVYLRQKAH